MKRLAKFEATKADLLAKIDAVLEAASANEDGRFTDEQQKELDGLKARLASTNAMIEEQKRLDAEERAAPAIYRREPLEGAPQVTGMVERDTLKPFASLGEQLVAIVNAGKPDGTIDRRLYGAASGGSANVGADGGFLIQKDFVPDLMKEAFESGALASRCAGHEVSEQSDGLEVPYVDETSRATGSRWGGVQVYRRAEADTVTATKPKIGLWECRLEDMMGLAYLTERLMRDAPAMAGVFREAFVDEFGFKLDDEIYRGTGTAQCLGIKNADCTVTVAKESGQAAATIVAENVIKMWARVLPRSKSRGIWVVNTECGPQLQKLFVPIGVSGQLIYMPPGGLTQSPHGTIYGRPVIEIEHADELGTVGDIAFLDLSQYKLVRKGGIEAADSIHVRFIYNERTLRWVVRVNGGPKLKSPITPYKGTKTLSPFVTLATRS